MEKVRVTVDVKVTPEAKKILQEMAMSFTLSYLDGITTWDWHSLIPYALEDLGSFDYFVYELKRSFLEGSAEITGKGLENRYKKYLLDNPWSCNSEPEKIKLTPKQEELFTELNEVVSDSNRTAALDYCGYVVVFDNGTYKEPCVYSGIKTALEGEKERRSRTLVGSGAPDQEDNK